MHIESICLLGALCLGILHIMAASAAATKQRGSKWNLSSRDNEPPPLKGMAGRIDRASQNFKESFPLFVAAFVLLQSHAAFGTYSQVGASLYLGARLIYFPVYAARVIYVRSALWCVSMLGIALVTLQSLL